MLILTGLILIRCTPLVKMNRYGQYGPVSAVLDTPLPLERIPKQALFGYRIRAHSMVSGIQGTKGLFNLRFYAKRTDNDVR